MKSTQVNFIGQKAKSGTIWTTLKLISAMNLNTSNMYKTVDLYIILKEMKKSWSALEIWK